MCVCIRRRGRYIGQRFRRKNDIFPRLFLLFKKGFFLVCVDAVCRVVSPKPARLPSLSNSCVRFFAFGRHCTSWFRFLHFSFPCLRIDDEGSFCLFLSFYFVCVACTTIDMI